MVCGHWLPSEFVRIKRTQHSLLVARGALEAKLAHEIVDLFRSARAVLVPDRLWSLLCASALDPNQTSSLTAVLAVDPVQQRREDLPGNIELVVPDKVGVVALERIEDESLVRLRDLGIGESLLVRQVQLDGDRARRKAGQLGIHLHVDGLGWLDSEHELVPRDVVEDALRGVLELDADLDLALVERCGEPRSKS